MNTASRYFSRIKHLSMSLLLLTACCSLVSCSASPGFITPPTRAYYSPVDYYVWLQMATVDELDTESRRLELAREAGATAVIPSIQFAMLHSVPAQQEADVSAAIALLEAVIASSSGSGRLEKNYLSFAALWLTQLNLRASLRLATATQADGAKRVAELEEQIKQLQVTIDAFTSIEQQLIQRELKQSQP